MDIYMPAKFRWDISILGWDKTTSGFRNRTAAILEFSFRFRFWRMHFHRHVILHMPAKFRSNQTIGGGVMTSYWFFKMAAIESEMYFYVIWYLDNLRPFGALQQTVQRDCDACDYLWRYWQGITPSDSDKVRHSLSLPKIWRIISHHRQRSRAALL